MCLMSNRHITVCSTQARILKVSRSNLFRISTRGRTASLDIVCHDNSPRARKFELLIGSYHPNTLANAYLSVIFSLIGVSYSEEIFLFFKDNLKLLFQHNFLFKIETEGQSSLWYRLTFEASREDLFGLLNVEFKPNRLRSLLIQRAIDIIMQNIDILLRYGLNVGKCFGLFCWETQKEILQSIFTHSGKELLVKKKLVFNSLQESMIFPEEQPLLLELLVNSSLSYKKTMALIDYITFHHPEMFLEEVFFWFQKNYPSEAAKYADKVLSHLKVGHESLRYEDIQILLRLKMTGIEIGKDLDLLILDNINCSRMAIFRPAPVFLEERNFDFFELEQIHKFIYSVIPNANILGHIFNVDYEGVKELIGNVNYYTGDEYLFFLASRIDYFSENHYLPEYFGYIRKRYPELLERFRSVYQENIQEWSPFSEKQLKFYNLLLMGDPLKNRHLLRLFENKRIFHYSFYCYIAAVWEDISDYFRYRVIRKLLKEQVSLSNYHYMVEIVCKESFKSQQIFADVFSYVRSAGEAMKFLNERFRKIPLLYRLQMAGHFYFVNNFQDQRESFGVAILIELCVEVSASFTETGHCPVLQNVRERLSAYL
jgi:hypothetical protein